MMTFLLPRVAALAGGTYAAAAGRPDFAALFLLVLALLGRGGR